MTKPLALVGSIGSTTKITDMTSLQAAEMEAMCRILEREGYRAQVAQATTNSKREPKFPTGREAWNGEGKVELVWIHQQTPNYIGGPNEAICEAIGLLAKGLRTAKKCFRLVVDNNESMRHKSVYSIEFRKECHTFPLCAAEFRRKEEGGNWYEVGIPETADPDAGLPFIYTDITSTQLLLTSEIFGLTEEKTVDFCYIGTSRASKKKQDARLASLGDFLDHSCANYSGSLFKKRCGFIKGWQLMSEARAHLIVRDPGMDQTPLHRYLQALVHGAIPIVLNEPEPVKFIHDPTLQNLLRVTSLKEGLALVERRDELKPLLAKELEYWVEFDHLRGAKLEQGKN